MSFKLLVGGLILLFIVSGSVVYSQCSSITWQHDNESSGIRDSVISERVTVNDTIWLFADKYLLQSKLSLFLDSVSDFHIISNDTTSLAYVSSKQFEIGKVTQISYCPYPDWNEDLAWTIYYSEAHGVVYRWRALGSIFGPRVRFRKIAVTKCDGTVIDLTAFQKSLYNSEDFYSE